MAVRIAICFSTPQAGDLCSKKLFVFGYYPDGMYNSRYISKDG
jgi:hypothetical protein